ncbi:hypothetical protein [Vitiosangium sp. GDMCC 1.1324]|uniref:hypothetical protein n=1 Tax=Vitiosangium sp. (strain GDMCC 1.1324) TaxID=2138576 RepID=UPI00130EF2A6|nr:hypothetical protein [Vitiosangium sp. GDMCC 1.1324]
MTLRELILSAAILFCGCVRRPEPFSTPSANDNSIIFPLSTGGGFVEVNARQGTYEMDGEVLRALMVVANDLFPPRASTQNLPCWARQEAHTYRFTRRENIIFVYVDEDLAYCGRTVHAMDSGAKYAISKDGRILRRVIGSEPDHVIWRLTTPDGGEVTVVAEPGVSPKLEDLEKPDSGIVKIVTEPMDMPGLFVLKPIPGFVPIEVGPDFPLGNTMSPFDDAGTWQWRDGKRVPVPQASPPVPALDPDGGTPNAGSPGDAGTSGLGSPPGPPDSGVGAP